jgi:hypothetical protein
VALLLQSEPNLTPDQVKFRLMQTTTKLSSTTGTGAGLLNIQRAVDSPTIMGNANVGVPASNVLSNPATTINVMATWSTAKWSTAKWSTMTP